MLRIRSATLRSATLSYSLSPFGFLMLSEEDQVSVRCSSHGSYRAEAAAQPLAGQVGMMANLFLVPVQSRLTSPESASLSQCKWKKGQMSAAACCCHLLIPPPYQSTWMWTARQVIGWCSLDDHISAAHKLGDCCHFLLSRAQTYEMAG